MARHIDLHMSALFAFPEDVIVQTEVHQRYPGFGPFNLVPHLPDIRLTVTLEGGSVELNNFVLPSFYHTIYVNPKKGEGRVEKAYVYRDEKIKDEEWWTT